MCSSVFSDMASSSICLMISLEFGCHGSVMTFASVCVSGVEDILVKPGANRQRKKLIRESQKLGTRVRPKMADIGSGRVRTEYPYVWKQDTEKPGKK